MRWNPFKRAESVDATDSSFETTVVDDVAAARMAQAQAQTPDGVAVEPPPAPVLSGAAPIVESESIGHVGRYALKTILGKGGLGTVYAAWDPLLSRTVALKTLHIDADPSDTGVYIAMERLQGQDLRHLLQQGVRPGPVEAAQVVRRVADALAYAHRKGVVHCDVKPANIFMTGRMHPKVLDFGIARVAHRDVPALEGVMAGSPYYLAPEQLDGRSVDRRSDVYSLGVVLYELLVGKKPFEGSSLEEITPPSRPATRCRRIACRPRSRWGCPSSRRARCRTTPTSATRRRATCRWSCATGSTPPRRERCATRPAARPRPRRPC